ncbi:wsc domain protein [Grosmannia clavigera kw1407]|uniref:Wsc domain protein n=1 Tax=Grosmannia clavigera (strain kw1407 / UAMH 11150) TaxID=655863 RepID=F0XFZ0_GROCL|nr:wsc domain protein [Grosmannia clavigera kw1407]EFX03356.1 wsc domain protein [Grosmannia clavigera kw1407]
MKCTTLLAFSAAYLAGAAAAASSAAAATTKMGVEQPSSAPIIDQPVVQGCFSSAGSLNKTSKEQYNSRGQCGQTVCQAQGKWVAATTEGTWCYCGDSYPPNSTLVDDSKCNTPCTGYGVDACGGVGYWTVYNTGIELYEVTYDESSSSSSSSSSSATSTSSATTKATQSMTTTTGGHTVFVTQTNSASSSAEAKKSHSSTAGIAAGVVVGVVVAAAVAGGAIFYIRRRRNQEIEDEHRRNAAVNSFFGKPPGSSGGFSGTDTRLDPVMAQRRLSDGSIADNQDYSRKILRTQVTNA